MESIVEGLLYDFGQMTLPLDNVDKEYLEKPKKFIKLLSACRLDDKIKGARRTEQLIKALDKYCKENGKID